MEDQKQDFEKKIRIYSFLRRSLYLLPIVVGIATTVYTAFSVAHANRLEHEAKRIQSEVMMREAESNQQNVREELIKSKEALVHMEALQRQLQDAQLRRSKGRAVTSPKIQSSNNEIESLRDEVGSLREQVKSFEMALGDDPAKKMAVVLLRRDIDSLVESEKSQVADLKSQMLSAHEDAKSNIETVKWLLGLVGVSNVIAPLASALLARKAAETKL